MSSRTEPKALGWLALLCRLALGGLFVLAGVLKLSEPQAFADAVKGFKILPEHLIVLATYSIPWTELFAGVLLILGIWSRAATLVIGGMLVVFIAGVLSVMAREIDTKCSCFGDLEWPCGAGVGWCQVIRNTVMLAMGAVILRVGPGPLALWREGSRERREAMLA